MFLDGRSHVETFEMLRAPRAERHGLLVNGTLVNTGTQFFSGTIAGSGPVILYDDRFRFDVDLSTGETLGTVHFSRSKDAPH